MQSQRAITAADLSGLDYEDFFAWTRRSAELLNSRVQVLQILDTGFLS